MPAGGATLKTRAFQADWTASPVRTDAYAIDASAPTITAHVFPSALSGWHRTPATVTFTCADNTAVASCSAAATVTIEGAGQVVTGTAVDTVGHETALPVTVHLDLTPPDVELTSPVDGVVTSNASLAVTGQVSDALSGLASVTCNNVAATVVDGVLSCSVTLRPGRNVVVVAARDVAGHSASHGITVTLAGTVTQLSMTPSQRTMLVGESLTLSLRDEFGLAPANALWQTSDPQIVSLPTDDPPVLTALAEGSATITASKNGVSAGSQIAVLAGDTLPAGTTRWTLPTVTSLASCASDSPGAWRLVARRRSAVSAPSVALACLDAPAPDVKD